MNPTDLILDVALARSRSPDEYVAALMQAVTLYPSVPLASPVVGWLDDLEELGKGSNIPDTVAFACAWRSTLALCSKDRATAERQLTALYALSGLKPANLQLVELAKYRLGSMDRPPEDDAPALSEPVRWLRTIARAEATVRRAPAERTAVWKAVLEALPPEPHGLRLYVLFTLVELEPALWVPALADQLADPEEILRLGEKYPGLVSEARLAHARSRPSSGPGTNNPLAVGGMGLAEKLGCVGLLLGALAIGALILYARFAPNAPVTPAKVTKPRR